MERIEKRRERGKDRGKDSMYGEGGEEGEGIDVGIRNRK